MKIWCIFLLFPFFQFKVGRAQPVHTKTAWLLETDSMPEKLEEFVYDQDGNMISSLREGGTQTSYTYDESGRNTTYSAVNGSREYHCKLTYPPQQVVLFFYEPMDSGGFSFSMHSDSMSTDSLLILTRIKKGTIITGDTVFTRNTAIYFTYDAKGNKTSEVGIDGEGRIFNWEKTKWSAAGDTVMTRKGAGSNDRCLDSGVTCYDKHGRVTDMYRFQFPRAKGYAVTTHIEIVYDQLPDDTTGYAFNAQIIRGNFPYIHPGIRLNPGPFPVEINVTVQDIDLKDGKGDSDYRYYYNYDDAHRLTHITGTGIKPYDEVVNTDIGINYSDTGTAVINHYGVNYAGTRVSGKTETYNGTELIEWSYNNEWGFPFSTTKYVYTYYE